MADGTGEGGTSTGRGLARALAVLVVAGLTALLLWPDGLALNRFVVQVYVFFLQRGMPPSVTPEDYAVLLNVLAFALLGMLGVLVLRGSPGRVVASLVAFSVVVELFQAIPGVARDPSLLDVACNALGAGVGVALASLVRPHPRHGDDVAGEQAGGDQPVDEGRDVGGERLGG